MPDLRTEAAVGKLVEGVQADLTELIDLISRAKDVAEALIDPTKGINGLSGFLRGQSTLLGEMIKNVEDESRAVHKKMLGTDPLPEIKVVTGG